MFNYFTNPFSGKSSSYIASASNYAKKALSTAAHYADKATNYAKDNFTIESIKNVGNSVISAANQVLPQYVKSLFSGTSDEHFAKASDHVYEAGVSSLNCAADIYNASGNISLTGVQLVASHTIHHYVDAKMLDLNMGLEAAAYIAKYMAPEASSTYFLAQGAKATSAAVVAIAANPLTTAAVTAGLVIGGNAFHNVVWHKTPLLDAFPIVKAVKNVGNSVLDAKDIAVNVGYAALEGTAGTALFVKELLEGSAHQAVDLDPQIGFGDKHDSVPMAFNLDFDSYELTFVGEATAPVA